MMHILRHPARDRLNLQLNNIETWPMKPAFHASSKNRASTATFIKQFSVKIALREGLMEYLSSFKQKCQY